MATTGQTISNPITGERITFLRTTRDTKGASLLFDCKVAPGGVPLPSHIHAVQEERFEILSGTLGVMIGGKKRTYYPGERVVLPARVAHQWWNAGSGEVHFRVEVTPARNLETVLEAVSGMAHAGKMNKKCMPSNPFVLAQFGKLSETYLPGIPMVLQKIGLTMGSMMGRLLGYDPTFSAYRGSASQAVAASLGERQAV